MVRLRSGLPVLALSLLATFGLAGCVTSTKYKLAKEGTPAASPMDWSAADPSAELTLATVIVFKGPGSWKREARWDEYEVKLANRSARPFVVETAELIDVLGQPQVPGDNPWKLEKLSYTNWEKYGKTGLKMVAGAGAVALYGTAVMASAYGEIMAGGAAGGGGAAVLAVIPVVAVVDITAVAVMNHHNKKKVQEEFERRRMKLPLTVAPGATVAGSWFFPMVPGPQRLIVRGRSGEQLIELTLDLKPLAGLHLTPAEKK